MASGWLTWHNFSPNNWFLAGKPRFTGHYGAGKNQPVDFLLKETRIRKEKIEIYRAIRVNLSQIWKYVELINFVSNHPNEFNQFNGFNQFNNNE